MVILKIVFTLFCSYLGVLIQEHLPYIDQWVVIYTVVFLVSWFGGMIQGMISTVFSLSLAGLILIPEESFDLHHLAELLVLTCLGFWFSYSVHIYKKSLVKLGASKELDKARSFLDTLLDNIPMMVFVKDAQDLRFVKFNKSGLDLLGFDLDDLIGKNDFDFFPVDQASEFIKKDREVLNQTGSIDIPREYIDTKYKGKRILHTKKISIFDANGKPLYLLGVSEDITDVIEAEALKIKILAEDAAKSERLRIQERESFVSNAISSLSLTLDYQETLNRLVSIVVPSLGDWSTLSVIDGDGVFKRVTSVHRDPKLQSLLNEFVERYPPNHKDIELRKAMDFGEASLLKEVNVELLKLRSSDERRLEICQELGIASSVVIPIKSRNKISGVLSIVRGPERKPFDELDLMVAEELGRRAGIVLENSLLFKSTQIAVRARDEFLSIASHELKTPITALKMQLQMLQRTNGEDKSFKPLGNAVKQIDRLTVLVDDLLNVSKIESGKMSYLFQSLMIGDLVTEVIDILRTQFNAAGVDLVLNIHDNAEIDGDRYRLEQVFVNLLNNALKYGEAKTVSVNVFLSDESVVVSFTDQGKGIPAEFHKRVFDKFERGRQDSTISGLGLGLFISNEIVMAHGGHIELKSHPGEGAEFKIILPRHLRNS